jgi:uncharacterized protein YcfJ
MRKQLMIAAAALAATVGTMAPPIAMPAYAQAGQREGLDGYTDRQGRWHRYTRAQREEARQRCERERQRSSNNSAIIGGIAGALIGNQVAGRGARTEGTVVGGVGGAFVGRQISNKRNRC